MAVAGMGMRPVGPARPVNPIQIAPVRPVGGPVPVRRGFGPGGGPGIPPAPVRRTPGWGGEPIAAAPVAPVLGSFKEGTDSVPETGAYQLHEGEKVVPKKENKMATHHSPEEKAHFSRAMHKLHGGALHRHLGIPEDEDIPMAKKEEAAHSDNPHVAAMGRLAVAMHGWKHPGKSKK